MNDMEKNQVSESEDFAAMLEETMVKFRPGQVVKGVVAQVSDDGVVVSIPGKADGFIKKNDLVTTDCKVDDEIEAEVVKLNDGEGYVLLSERKVMATKNWEKLVAEYDEGAYVEATGREAVNGGLIADVMGVRAFIPASHLSRRFVENIGEFVGKTMTVKIIEVDNDLAEFSVQSVTRGIDALGEVTVRVTAEDGGIYTGRGADGDIIVSSTKAYLNALNRLLSDKRAGRA